MTATSLYSGGLRSSKSGRIESALGGGPGRKSSTYQQYDPSELFLISRKTGEHNYSGDIL